MLFCPRCRRTYSLHDYLTFLRPLSCFHCGNKRLVRWDRSVPYTDNQGRVKMLHILGVQG